MCTAITHIAGRTFVVRAKTASTKQRVMDTILIMSLLVHIEKQQILQNIRIP